MDIVLIFNGLGNQMSQYAFYLAKRKVNASTKCIYYPDSLTCQHNGFELNNIFGIEMDGCENVFYGRLLDAYLWSQVCDSRKRHWLRVIFESMSVNRICERKFDFDQDCLDNGGYGIHFYYGGWHNPKYFSSIESEIRNTFHFDITSLDSRNKLLLEDINNCNSISIHVRRGDFLMQSNLFGNISNKEYYIRAIAYIKKYVESPVFYVFSDDIVWCRENFFEPEINFIDWNTGTDSWKDMLLISSCKHNINANSTFSWWGAWLNQNPQKIVIVPDKFMNSFDSEKIYPNEWIKISTK